MQNSLLARAIRTLLYRPQPPGIWNHQTYFQRVQAITESASAKIVCVNTL